MGVITVRRGFRWLSAGAVRLTDVAFLMTTTLIIDYLVRSVCGQRWCVVEQIWRSRSEGEDALRSRMPQTVNVWSLRNMTSLFSLATRSTSSYSTSIAASSKPAMNLESHNACSEKGPKPPPPPCLYLRDLIDLSAPTCHSLPPSVHALPSPAFAALAPPRLGQEDASSRVRRDKSP